VRSRLLLFLSLFLLLPVAASQAQGAPASAAAAPPNQIALFVQATDKAGVPVRGLTQQDFAITDNKHAENITAFLAVDARAAADSVEVVFVVDGVNSNLTTLAFDRDQFRKFLMHEGGDLSVPTTFSVVTDAGATIPQPPTFDGKALIASYDKSAPGLRQERNGLYQAEDRLSWSMKAVATLAAYAGQRPGRKLFVWLSPGWPLLTGPRLQYSAAQHQQIFNEVVAQSSALLDAGITMYSIDPLGTSDAASIRTNYYKAFLKGVKSPSEAVPANLALQVMSIQSGGRTVNASNDVVKEISDCAADARNYYVLSFVPPPGKAGEYHELQVKVNKPDVQVRTRTGYYAQP